VTNGFDHLVGRRICLVLGHTTGGIGRHVRSLIDAINDVPASPTVICPADVAARFDFPCPVRTCETGDLSGLRSLRRAMPEPALVHAHGVRPAFAALLAGGGRHRPPVITTWHNQPNTGHFPGAERLGRTVASAVARGSAANLAVSSDLLLRVFTLGGAVRLLRVGPEVPIHRELPAATERVRASVGGTGRSLVVCVARLAPQKGVEVLVEAAARLTGHPSRPVFVVAGDGPSRAELAHQIWRSGAPVTLLGERSDVPALLAAADLAVLSSHWEGSPLAAVEAMNLGVPLVATAVGGMADLGALGAARLVNPGDPGALADALGALLDSPEERRRLGARGRQRSTVWPDARETSDAVLAVYRELLVAAPFPAFPDQDSVVGLLPRFAVRELR
jgi:glycosyltransferase involved in cell wall biosynthesis